MRGVQISQIRVQEPCDLCSAPGQSLKSRFCDLQQDTESSKAQENSLFLFFFSNQVVSDCFVTPWTIAHQAPLSIGFSRQEYWSGLPCPSPGDLPNSGIEPGSPALQADSLSLSHQGSIKRSHNNKKPLHSSEEVPSLTTTRESPHAGKKTQGNQK